MSQNQHEFKQQILFNESDDAVIQVIEEHQESIVVDNLAYQEAQQLYVEEQERQKGSGKKHWLWRLLAVLFVAIIGYETVVFLLDGFNDSPIITSIYSLFITGLLFLLLSLLVKELLGLKTLKRQEKNRVRAQLILSEQSNIKAVDFCQAIHQKISYDFSLVVEEKWQKSLSLELNDAERLQLYDLNVLSEVDNKAITEIAKYSSETMVMVAISPLALVDMLIVFWRNIKMVDKISGLYGLNLGYWSRIQLIKQVFTNMFLVGASEMIVDLGTDALGADLLGKFSGRLAQGFAAGMLTARLGLNTINSCRPLPFIQQKPKLSQVRNALLKQVKNLVIKK